MADVRSMLRGERNSRKVKHSQAAYTSTGQLMCSVCRCPIKSTNLFDAHLQSEGHLALVQRIKQSRQSNPSTPEASATSHKRKRKADTEDTQAAKRRNVAEDTDTESTHILTSPLQSVPTRAKLAAIGPQGKQEHAGDKQGTAVDEAEWDAFEKEMEQLKDKEQADGARQAAATISAAPVTAQQLAAQAREEQSAQRSGKESEIQEEQDDAEQQAMDEFARMDELDERMRSLRARREAIQQAQGQKAVSEAKDDSPREKALKENEEEHQSGTLEESEEDEEDDAWRGLGGL